MPTYFNEARQMSYIPDTTRGHTRLEMRGERLPMRPGKTRDDRLPVGQRQRVKAHQMRSARRRAADPALEGRAA